MIFNNGSDIYSMNGITESPYPLGLEGALMHVYENECNYNAIMKSVGISELRYYQETGKDLFVHEAGAFAGFITKIKLFFKKVIEKIKSIFAKFAAKINQFTMDDKKFVKKYQNEILRKDLTDFEFTGYTFAGIDTFAKHISDTSEIEAHANALEHIKAYDPKQAADQHAINANNYKYSDDGAYGAFKDSDAKDDFLETCYAKIAKKSGSMTLDEMRSEIKDLIYGDGGKETLDHIDRRKTLDTIENTSKTLKTVEKAKNKIVNSLEKISSEFDKLAGKINKAIPAKDLKDNESDNAKLKNSNTVIKAAGQWADIFKSLANAYTEAFGMLSAGYKDQNRQCKAICVKMLSYKHESVTYGGYDSSDIFADVVIR